MPFGLKNDRAIFQRLVTEVFKSQIRRYMKVYVDAMIVKTRVVANHLINSDKHLRSSVTAK